MKFNIQEIIDNRRRKVPGTESDTGTDSDISFF